MRESAVRQAVSEFHQCKDRRVQAGTQALQNECVDRSVDRAADAPAVADADGGRLAQYASRQALGLRWMARPKPCGWGQITRMWMSLTPRRIWRVPGRRSINPAARATPAFLSCLRARKTAR